MNLSIKEQYSLLLPVLGSVVLYLLFGYQLQREDFILFLAAYNGLFICVYWLIVHSKLNFWVLAGLGIIFRLLLFPAIPNLSQDFYRFLWDGRLLIQGINPYLITPEAYLEAGNEIVPQARALYNGMGELNGSHYSNYPPINQLCFAIAALFSKTSILGSVLMLKAILIAADIGILYFGKKLLTFLKLPEKNIFWFFLNPFIIIELTGNLHFEGVMLFFFIWGLYLLLKKKWVDAGVLVGISISVKLLPLLLLPLFVKWFYKKEVGSFQNITSSFKFYVVVILTVLLTFAPFISEAFISNFSATIGLWFQNFEFNASIYYVIRWIGFQTVGWNIIGTVGKILPVIIILLILGLSFFRKNTTKQQLIEGLLLAVSFYFLLSTTVHPWYIATPLLLSIFTRFKYAIVWSFVVMFSYSAYGIDGFNEQLGWVAFEYIVVIGVVLYELFTRKKEVTLQQ